MPLLRCFALSTKPGRNVWLEPEIDHKSKSVRFVVRSGQPPPEKQSAITHGTAAVNARGKKEKASFRCVICKVGQAKGEYIDEVAGAIGLGLMPLAVVAEGQRGRVFVDFDQPAQFLAIEECKRIVESPALHETLPLQPCRGTFASNAQGRIYGFKTFSDYFTQRQLVALSTFSDLVAEARKKIIADGGSEEYATGVSTYLGLGVSRLANTHCTLAVWSTSRDQSVNAFSRQGIPMTWDFPEVSPFADAAGDLSIIIDSIAKILGNLPAQSDACVNQLDAASLTENRQYLYSTDPPYYDNVSYADLSDFFYVWLRRTMANLYPDIFSTLLVPKKQELIAAPYRFDGSKDKAQRFFEDGFAKAFAAMLRGQLSEFPLTVYYAFKQAESDEEDGTTGIGVASTGWETMLEALLRSGFQVTATWPMRTERPTGVKVAVNALASSIILACRARGDSAPITTRKDFLSLLKKELPEAVRNLQKGNIAPVDLAQAAIGPGMGVFSRYQKVLESDGTSMRVRAALGLINQSLDEVLSEQEGEFDPDTRWALAWFEQHAFDEGLYGEAEVLATAKALSVAALDETKILHSRAGKVRLLRRDELAADWNPSTEHRLTVWAVTQHLIRSLDKNGETATATLASKVGGLAETARDLAYRLYILSERKGWAEEAGYYNSLVVSWPAIAPKTFALN
jgi:putative DNA methylase